MFHVNPKTGEAGKCSAKAGRCPFGDMNVHYTTEEAARSAFEGSMASEILKTTKKDGRSKRNNWANIDDYRGMINANDEVFVHPQGKIAIFRFDGRMEVFREGKKSSTSGSIQQLRAGRGAWQTLKTPGQALPNSSDYHASFVNTDAESSTASPTPVTGAGRKGKATPTPSNERERANLAAGYPMDSQLDASRKDTIPVSQIKKEYSWKDQGAWNGSAILPVNERVNPHKDFDTSEWLTGWNHTNSDGTVVPTNIEVWKSPSPTGKGFNYKLVATSGSIYAVGSTGGFYHDQSGGNMGDKWELCGAFVTEKGGQTIGEIPDRKMPLYTYK